MLLSRCFRTAQQLRNSCLSERSSHGEGILALVVLDRWVGTGLQQQFADVEMPPGHCEDQGGSPMAVGCIKISARPQMQAYRLPRA